METIVHSIPAIVSAILLLVLILTVITNIITQVLKKVTRDKLPTNVLVILVAMGLTLCAFFALCQIMGWIVLWYMLAAAIVVGFFVAFAAMFGFDKFRQTLEQITNLEK